MTSKIAKSAVHQRMLDQLARQLGYLSRSAKLFDLHFFDEGIRIATSLRVLFHDGPREPAHQGSILKLLGRPPIQLVTTCTPAPSRPRKVAYDGYLHLPGNLRPWNEYLERSTLVSADEWWNQIIFQINGVAITRKKLVLAAAGKDGGAHADSRLNPEYEALFTMWHSMQETREGTHELPVPHQHLLALRRFALEVLASEQLTALADGIESNAQSDDCDLYCAPQACSPVMQRALEISHSYIILKTERSGADPIDCAAHLRVSQLVDEIRRPMLLWLGEALLRREQYKDAAATFRRLVATHPHNMLAQYGLGFALLELRELAASESSLLRALDMSADHAATQMALAEVYVLQGRFEAAIHLCDSVLARDPTNEDAHKIRETVAGSQGGPAVSL